MIEDGKKVMIGRWKLENGRKVKGDGGRGAGDL